MGSFDGWTSFTGVKPVEERFKESIVKRARKRHVSYSMPGVYVVKGDVKLNDTHPRYTVRLVGKRWRCDCYESQHGGTRAHNACSHVVAVLLFRETEGGNAEQVASGEGEVAQAAEGTARPSVGSLPSAEPSPSRKPKKSKKNKKEKNRALSPASVWLRPSDPRLALGAPVPEWLQEYRPHQVEAALEVEEAFTEGAGIVYLDAPTGSGKTVLADVIARLIREHRNTYICTSKNLQDQVLRDFPYARKIMGRANYLPINPVLSSTCDDCTGTPGNDQSCQFCPSMKACPYRVAKREAVDAQMAVLNTAYWLREANFAGEFSRANRLIVIDECDTLEDQLLSFVEFSVTDRRLADLGLEAPKKGSHYTTIAAWLTDDFNGRVMRKMAALPDTMQGRREQRGLAQLLDMGLFVADQIATTEKVWFRDNGAYGGGLAMKPTVVDGFGEKYVWRNGGKFLMMSGTIISAEEMQRDLGATAPFRVVRVPMTFPVENRIINVAGVADMTYKNQEQALPVIGKACAKILERHPNDRILIHTVSYKNTDFIRGYLKSPRVITHTAKDKEEKLAEYRRTPNAVMLSPSMDRGVDLREDDCRVQVIIKCPKPHIGDERVSRRLHMRNGNEWYTVETIRALVQMTGRAVRSETDHATTYILDQAFSKLRRESEALFPKWWLEGLNRRFATRELM